MTLPFTEQGAVRAPSPSRDPKLESKNENPSSFCGDCEGLLDRMLEQCQTRVTARHPGFGRKLVPYFNDDNDDGSTANGIRHQQQKGEVCGFTRGGQKSGPGFKRSPRSSRKTNFAISSRRSKKLDSTSVGFYRFQDNKGGSSSPTATVSSSSSGCYEDYTTRGLDFSPQSLCSLFAGPICFNSPPPEDLPMPTAVLLAKAMCLS